MSALRITLLLLAFLSLFWFPYPLTLVLSFLASLFFPFVGVSVGLLSDLLFYSPHLGAIGTIPYATVLGIFITLASFFVRTFVKERIIFP